MRVLIDLTHPADVHLFKHLVRALSARGDSVLVTTRQKDITTSLTAALGIDSVCLSRMGRGLGGLALELLVRDARLLRTARSFAPDVMLARIGISIGLVGALLGVPRIVVEDTEHARLQLAISLPFATRICTGMGYLKDYGPRQVRFRGMPIQAYLASRYFRPDPQPLLRCGVRIDQPYVVMRMISWGAAHDVGCRGNSAADLAHAVAELSRFGRVLITSEKPLPPGLEHCRLPVPMEHLHDLLAFARLYIGEGITVAAEAAILGVPAICCNPQRVGYLLALEGQFQLARCVDTLREGLVIARQWLDQGPALREDWNRRRQNLEDQSEDVVAFLLRVIDQTVREHPVRSAGRHGRR